ncbi:MAG: sialidase family protein [Kofleriaceae bacterium]
MGHAHRVVLGLVAACAGCGDNIEDPFVALVRVSGETPFPDGCGGAQIEGRPFPSVEVEPSVAIDPTNPQHLVGAWQQDRWTTGGANGIGVGASFDGGATWMLTTPRLGVCSGGDGAYTRGTDPWLTFAADGTAYLFALVFDAGSPRNAMVSSRSTDGGLTWRDPEIVRFDNATDVFNDKNSITADPVDPGRVYAVWDRLTGLDMPQVPQTRGPTWFARTTDGVWETARAIYDPGADAQTIANEIAVLPDGTLIDVFDLITGTSGNAPSSAVAVIRSSDKGETWSDATVIAAMHGEGVQDPYNNVFIRSGTDLPQIAVDRATGALYVVWQDHLNATGFDGAVIASSVDGGVTWTAPRQVNGAPVAAFTPNVAVAADGTVGVMYYDLRNVRPSDADAFRVTAWLATSHDGGVIWDDEMLSEPFDLRPALLQNSYFLGDYQAMAVAGDVFVPLFVGANRDNDDKTDVYVRTVK